VLAILEEVHAAEAKSFSSATIDSLNTSRNSPSSQLKEACALAVREMSSCSPSMANTFINSNIFGNLVSICADDSFNTPSNKGNTPANAGGCRSNPCTNMEDNAKM
jgi:hypothetical protein